MPRLFVGLHAALVVIIALFGLSFLLDPCGGGGDLCLGGALGLVTLGAAIFGAIGIVIWLAAHRASLLLILDSVLVTLAVFTLPSVAADGPATTTLGLLLLAVLGIPAGALAGSAVATRRIEPLVAIVLLVGVAVLGGGGAGAATMVGLGLLAIGAGWLWKRSRAADETPGRHLA